MSGSGGGDRSAGSSSARIHASWPAAANGQQVAGEPRPYLPRVLWRKPGPPREGTGRGGVERVDAHARRQCAAERG